MSNHYGYNYNPYHDYQQQHLSQQNIEKNTIPANSGPNEGSSSSATGGTAVGDGLGQDSTRHQPAYMNMIPHQWGTSVGSGARNTASTVTPFFQNYGHINSASGSPSKSSGIVSHSPRAHLASAPDPSHENVRQAVSGSQQQQHSQRLAMSSEQNNQSYPQPTHSSSRVVTNSSPEHQQPTPASITPARSQPYYTNVSVTHTSLVSSHPQSQLLQKRNSDRRALTTSETLYLQQQQQQYRQHQASMQQQQQQHHQRQHWEQQQQNQLQHQQSKFTSLQLPQQYQALTPSSSQQQSQAHPEESLPQQYHSHSMAISRQQCLQNQALSEPPTSSQRQAGLEALKMQQNSRTQQSQAQPSPQNFHPTSNHSKPTVSVGQAHSLNEMKKLSQLGANVPPVGTSSIQQKAHRMSVLKPQEPSATAYQATETASVNSLPMQSTLSTSYADYSPRLNTPPQPPTGYSQSQQMTSVYMGSPVSYHIQNIATGRACSPVTPISTPAPAPTPPAATPLSRIIPAQVQTMAQSGYTQHQNTLLQQSQQQTATVPPEPEEKTNPAATIDSTQMESDLLAMVERMRGYQALSPAQFQTVWEKVKRGEVVYGSPRLGAIPDREEQRTPCASPMSALSERSSSRASTAEGTRLVSGKYHMYSSQREPTTISALAGNVQGMPIAYSLASTTADRKQQQQVEVSQTGYHASQDPAEMKGLSNFTTSESTLTHRWHENANVRIDEKTHTVGAEVLGGTPRQDGQSHCLGTPRAAGCQSHDECNANIQPPLQSSAMEERSFQSTDSQVGSSNRSETNKSNHPPIQRTTTPSQQSTYVAANVHRGSNNTGMVWPEAARKALAICAATYVSASANRHLSAEYVMNLLLPSPTFVELCETLERDGYTFDRGKLARELLNANPELVGSEVAASNTSGSSSKLQAPNKTGLKGEEHILQGGITEEDIMMGDTQVTHRTSNISNEDHFTTPASTLTIKNQRGNPRKTFEEEQTQTKKSLAESNALLMQPAVYAETQHQTPELVTETSSRGSMVVPNSSAGIEAAPSAPVSGVSALVPVPDLTVEIIPTTQPEPPSTFTPQTVKSAAPDQVAQTTPMEKQYVSPHLLLQAPTSSPLPDSENITKASAALTQERDGILLPSDSVCEDDDVTITGWNTRQNKALVKVGKIPSSEPIVIPDDSYEEDVPTTPRLSHVSALENEKANPGSTKRIPLPPNRSSIAPTPKAVKVAMQAKEQEAKAPGLAAASGVQESSADVASLQEMQLKAKPKRLGTQVTLPEQTPASSEVPKLQVPFPQSVAVSKVQSPPIQDQQPDRSPLLQPFTGHPERSQHVDQQPNANQAEKFPNHIDPTKAPPLFEVPIVTRLMKRKAKRVTNYNPATFANDILIATGRHPSQAPLNKHLFPLLDTLVGYIHRHSDLETVKWDIIDPEPTPSLASVPLVAPTSTDLKAEETDEDIVMSDIIHSTQGMNNNASSAGDVTVTAQATAPRRPGRPKKQRVSLAGGVLESTIATHAAKRKSGKASTGATRNVFDNTPNRTPGEFAVPAKRAPNNASASSSGPRHGVPSSDSSMPRRSNIAVVIPSRSPSTVSVNNDTNQRAVRGKRKFDENGEPLLSKRRPSPREMKSFKCRWLNCPAELHNLDTLHKHVIKTHGRATSSGQYPCLWEGCSESDNQKGAQQAGGQSHFENVASWERHIAQEHIKGVERVLGTGPPIKLPKDPNLDGYSSASEIEAILSDCEGRRVTPLAVPAPENHVPITPANFDRNSVVNIHTARIFNKAHGLTTAEAKKQSARASEFERQRRLGAGMEVDDSSLMQRFAEMLRRDDGQGILRQGRRAIQVIPDDGPTNVSSISSNDGSQKGKKLLEEKDVMED